jgi:hypothetical protein
MSARHLPVRPDLEQLRHQAKDLLRAIRASDPEALADLARFHPHPPPAAEAKLADAQLALARSYDVASWPRLVQACQLVDAIWNDDIDGVRQLITTHPNLIHENARGVTHDNWGPPMSHAANVGRDRIIHLLHSLGASDHQYAIGRAVLQGRVETARMLHRMIGSPKPPAGAFGGAAYTLNVNGTAFVFEIGGDMVDEHGHVGPPVDVVLESDSRSPERKHRILEMYAEHGFVYPDTPMMALHRGRLDLLERHISRDPSLLERAFAYAEIYPPQLRCQVPKPGLYDEFLPRTPLMGGTLLHVCVEYDELEIARWLLEHGMNANVRASVDENGFGGHTPLFNTVACYANFWRNFTGGWPGTQKPDTGDFARLLLDHGADPNVRASFRLNDNGTPRDYRDVTPHEWGEVFPIKIVVSKACMREIATRMSS